MTDDTDPLAGKIACSVAFTEKVIDRKTSTVYALIKSGELEAYVDGRSRKIVVDSIRKYIERRRQGIPLKTAKPSPLPLPGTVVKHPRGRPRKHLVIGADPPEAS